MTKRQEVRSRRINYVNATVNHVQLERHTRKGDPVFRITFRDEDGRLFVATTHTRGTYHQVINDRLRGQDVKLTWHHDARGNKIVLDMEGNGHAA